MRRTRWVAPVALLLGAAGGGAGAVAVEAGTVPRAAEPSVVALGTPVLSVRRVPAVLAGSAAEEALRARLGQWAATAPERSCAVVVGSTGEVLLDLRGAQPVVPASAQKLLTAAAALLALGPDAHVDATPLPELVARVLRDSDDAAAELLLGEVARASPAGGGADAGTAALRLLAAEGLDVASARLADGSGHSLENRVTCALLVEVLRLPATEATVAAGLAVAGESGTLADRFVGTPLVGHLRGKTGSLRGVAALAGVVDDGDGPLTFAHVVNAAPGEAVDEPAVVASQQELAEVLLGWSGAPGPDRLAPRPLPGGP